MKKTTALVLAFLFLTLACHTPETALSSSRSASRTATASSHNPAETRKATQTAFSGKEKKQITLEDMWVDYTFYPKYLNELKRFPGGYYTVLENAPDGTRNINRYRFENLEYVDTPLAGKELSFPIDEYTFSRDGSKVLVATATEPIYRHSKRAGYYVFDLKTRNLQKVFDGKIQSPAFSPAGDKVAFVFDNDLYYKDLQNGSTVRITTDGAVNSIINGLTDWVYEEEFGFVRAFQWNSTGSHLAYLRFDESRVPEFEMSVFGNDLYPSVTRFKYPKAGEQNSKVSLHIYELATGIISGVEIPVPYEYIPRIKWTKDPEVLSFRTMNRLQNDFHLFEVSVKDMVPVPVYHETSDTYINVRDILTFLDDGGFIISSEKDGYQHLYRYAPDGRLLNAVTSGDWEVTGFYGYDAGSGKLFFQSTRDGGMTRTLYSVNADGSDLKRLGPARGINRPLFSDDYRYFILNHQDPDTPPVYTLYDSDGNPLREVLNNSELKEKLSDYSLGEKRFSTLHTANGDFNMWMIFPPDFNPENEYPLLMYQYSGPGVQTVMDKWTGFDEYWYHILANKGYIVASVDGRGTGGRGRDFTHCTYGQLGKYETADQIAAARALGQLPYIDASRIGIWGWSFGGFVAANAILKGNDMFKMAISVAPVTSWRFYDTIYTERYMGLPEANPGGYDDNSPLFFAGKLKGNFLIIHGSGDDNVHVQNTMRMINAMIEAGVPFDSEIYPDRTHGIYRGKNTRLHLYRRMTDFILKNL